MGRGASDRLARGPVQGEGLTACCFLPKVRGENRCVQSDQQERRCESRDLLATRPRACLLHTSAPSP